MAQRTGTISSGDEVATGGEPAVIERGGGHDNSATCMLCSHSLATPLARGVVGC